MKYPKAHSFPLLALIEIFCDILSLEQTIRIINHLAMWMVQFSIISEQHSTYAKKRKLRVGESGGWKS